MPPCPHCGNMPQLELRDPLDKKYVIECKHCGVEFLNSKREKVHREWEKYYKEIIEGFMYEGV